MKIRMTKSFFYSLVLHLTVVALAFALFLVTRSDARPVMEKRCKIMLSQVCDCPPEEAKPKRSAVQKPNKPQPVEKRTEKTPEKIEPTPLSAENAAAADEQAHDASEPEIEALPEDLPAVMTQNEAIQAVEEEADRLAAASDLPPLRTEKTEKVSPEDAYIEAHLEEIMALLRKNLYYPRMARKRHIEGRVMVRFELLENGKIRNITITESEREILASAAVTTIERLEGRFPLPAERLVLNVPIIYSLH